MSRRTFRWCLTSATSHTDWVAALAALDADRAAALPQLCEAFPPTADSTGAERIAHALAREVLAGSRRRMGEQRVVLAQAATAAREDGDHHGEVELLLELPQPANASTRPRRRTN